MEILILSSTIIFSITSKKIHKLTFMNNLIKKDYKLDNYNYDKSIIYIIPVVNLGYLISNIKKYNVNNIDYLKNNSLIVPLTKKEKKIYSEYPSIATVININLFKNNKTNMILVDLDNTIYITNDSNNYIINDTKGPVSKLPKCEQYSYLMEELEDVEEIDKPKIKIKR